MPTCVKKPLCFWKSSRLPDTHRGASDQWSINIAEGNRANHHMEITNHEQHEEKVAFSFNHFTDFNCRCSVGADHFYRHCKKLKELWLLLAKNLILIYKKNIFYFVGISSELNKRFMKMNKHCSNKMLLKRVTSQKKP